MRLLLLSDLHGAIEQLERIDAEFKRSDAVLFAGDFAKFNETETGLPALKALCARHDTIFAVLGNCDKPDFIAELEAADINVQGALVFAEGLAFAGSGGGSKFTGTTPYERTDEELAGDLQTVHNAIAEESDGKWSNLVLIAHNPILNTKTDLVAPDVHVGSALLREFIEKVQPVLAVCGHIHESAGIDIIGRTTVINPGALAEGHYAVAELENTDSGPAVTKAELF